MHVHAVTALAIDTVTARFQQIHDSAHDQRSPLTFVANRTPPKFFLAGPPVVPPTAAEVTLKTTGGGTDVVLRLMWGPLPAPFPRALAGISGLLGLAILMFAGHTISHWMLTALLILLPSAALLYQQQGERKIQSILGRMLDGATFAPRPH